MENGVKISAPAADDGWRPIESATMRQAAQRIKALAALSPASPARTPMGGEVEALREALNLILPLAKGYVAKNNVGSNQSYIEHAEALAASSPSPAQGGSKGKSRGQIAYEGWAQGLAGCEWVNQTATQKRAWELAAQAVLSASPQPEAGK